MDDNRGSEAEPKEEESVATEASAVALVAESAKKGASFLSRGPPPGTASVEAVDSPPSG